MLRRATVDAHEYLLLWIGATRVIVETSAWLMGRMDDTSREVLGGGAALYSTRSHQNPAQ